MNLVRPFRVILLCAALGPLVACGGEEEEAPAETPAAAAAPADEAPAEAEPAEGPAEEASGSVCERARACCTAYVDAVAANTPGVTAATACAGVQNATGPGADATCTAAINGWRQSLEALSADVPSSCQ